MENNEGGRLRVVVYERRLVYLDVSSDLFGTVEISERQRHGLKGQATPESFDIEALFGSLGRKYSEYLVTMASNDRTCAITEFSQRFYESLHRNYLFSYDRYPLPDPIMLFNMRRQLRQASNMSLSAYVDESLSGCKLNDFDAADIDLDLKTRGELAGQLIYLRQIAGGRYDCYTVSHVIRRFLFRRKIRHSLKFGVCPYPPMLHVWISRNDLPVIDCPGTGEEFVTIMSISNELGENQGSGPRQSSRIVGPGASLSVAVGADEAERPV